MIGLWELHEQHPEPVEHELIRLGLRWRDLGTPRLSWRDLLVIVREAPRDSAITRALDPDAYLAISRWLEGLSYLLQVANVQRGNASGARKHDFPDPPSWASDEEVTTFGSGPVSIEDMAAMLGGDFTNFYD